MATNVPKTKRPRLGFRYQMEMNFTDAESKKVFLTRLDRAKSSLSPSGLRNVENYKLISSLLDRFEEEMGLDSNVHDGYSSTKTNAEAFRKIVVYTMTTYNYNYSNT